MSIPADGMGTLLIIFIMLVVTVLTRFSGFFLMSFVSITPRIECFISYMSSSVLIAITVPMAFNGDLAAFSALTTAAFVMISLKAPIVAIILGVGVAAFIRHFI